MRLKNRAAIVTGAASGIGKAIALLFAREGAKVALVDVEKERLETLEKEIRRGGSIGCRSHVDELHFGDLHIANKHLPIASTIICAHNHPSGDLRPSDNDFRIHNQLTEAGKILGLRVLDHVIVAKRGYYSFQESGLIG